MIKKVSLASESFGLTLNKILQNQAKGTQKTLGKATGVKPSVPSLTPHALAPVQTYLIGQLAPRNLLLTTLLVAQKYRDETVTKVTPANKTQWKV